MKTTPSRLKSTGSNAPIGESCVTPVFTGRTPARFSDSDGNLFLAAKHPRQGVTLSGAWSPVFKRSCTPRGPYWAMCRTNPKPQVIDGQNLIAQTATFRRTSSNYEAKMCKPKILRLI
jgi:hypothetical protein